MSEIVIRVEKLSKRYRIGKLRKRHNTLRDAIVSAFKRPEIERSNDENTIWALKDVSFEVKQGEVVGIIGRNGAGKSTLLKILSRITEPTEGLAEIHGRCGSLLEVGTGFHPELTGRDNIYLNGAILGMRTAEIDRKFDEIVNFAEVAKFIDTPVKHYSSGMHMRLAFAVAAHFEPEILLVDEVLAVGDVSFQKKCLGKIGDVARQGRTVLFVSHSTGAVQNLCRRAIWIRDGVIEADGNSAGVIERYLSHFQAHDGASPFLSSLDGSLEIQRVVMKDQSGTVTSSFQCGSGLTIEIHYLAKRPVLRPYLWITIESQFGPSFGASMVLDGIRPEKLEGSGQIRCKFAKLPLLPQQSYVVWMGGRTSDGRMRLLLPAEVANFRVTGSASDLGLLGERAEAEIGSAAPVVVAYTWEFADGTAILVDPVKQLMDVRGTIPAVQTQRGSP